MDESDSEEEPLVASDDEEYVPNQQNEKLEESDAEMVGSIDEESEYDSDESIEKETSQDDENLLAKDGTIWQKNPFSQHQTVSRNVLHEKGGPARSTATLTEKQIFKNIMSQEVCSIILRETNRKGAKITSDINNLLIRKYPDATKRPPERVFKPFLEHEIDAFLGILIIAGVHKSNKEHLSDLWKSDSIPLIRATMPRNRFQMLLRCIRFDNENTRETRSQTDKAAPIRDIWTMINSNLHKNYKPSESITVDEQLFPYRGKTKFTQYIPSKPSKYGIKVFWACDSETAYPLQGQLYTGKPAGGERQVNVGEKTVLDLVASYKNSGRNVTTDNFFTTLQLAHVLNSWNMTLVGTVRRNKRFLPPNMQPSKTREIFSTNFGYRKDVTVCSYVPKKNKSVILLSTMHTSPDVDQPPLSKPEIIKYYNKTKGGVDTMDKFLSEYTVKRRTNRWPLAFYYNLIDVAALAAYIIYKKNHPTLKSSGLRRNFLKDLAKQLCLPTIEARISDEYQIRNNITRSSIEMVLGSQMVVLPEPSVSQRDATGRVPIVGSCYICSNLQLKQRKTRKSCVNCRRPVCNEHCSNNPKCTNCNISLL